MTNQRLTLFSTALLLLVGSSLAADWLSCYSSTPSCMFCKSPKIFLVCNEYCLANCPAFELVYFVNFFSFFLCYYLYLVFSVLVFVLNQNIFFVIFLQKYFFCKSPKIFLVCNEYCLADCPAFDLVYCFFHFYLFLLLLFFTLLFN